MFKKIIYISSPVFVLTTIYIVVSQEYLSLHYVKDHFHLIKQFNESSHSLALLIYALIYIAVSALAIPGAAVLTLLGGALFGLIKGTLIVSLASRWSARP